MPAGIVFTGGCSNIAGLETLGRDITRLPVRVGMPGNISGLTDALRDPAYATGVGLLLWGAKNQPKSRGWGGLNFFGRVRGLLSKFFGG